MQLAPDDDFIGVTDDIVPGPEADTVYAGQDDDDLDALLGYGMYLGYDPAEVMGASRLRKRLRAAFRKVGKRLRSRFRKVGKRIRARIAKRRGKGGSVVQEFIDQGMQLTTPRGTATLGPEGIDWTSAEAQAAAAQAMPAEGGGVVDMVKRNPLLLAIPAGAIVLLLMRRRR